MEILDWRPALARRLADQPPAVPPSLAARLAGRVADRLAARRVRRRPPPPAGLLVVAIGNLRLGGTGKTPVTLALARDLAARGVRGAVLTRGYGADAPGPLRVLPDDPRAGDEARLVAAGLADRGWDVMQARRRADGLAALRARRPAPQVVLLEDGYQTGGVGRHLDVLILDAWSTGPDGVVPLAGPVVPWGPYRETARGAARAQVWLLESAAPPPGPAGVCVCGFSRRFALVAAGRLPPRVGARDGLVSGVARPEGFEAAARGALDREPVLAVRVADHARYDAGLVARILAEGRRRGVTGWLTTGKDWIKLAALWPAGVPVGRLDLEVAWHGAQTLPELVGERLATLGAGGPEG